MIGGSSSRRAEPCGDRSVGRRVPVSIGSGRSGTTSTTASCSPGSRALRATSVGRSTADRARPSRAVATAVEEAGRDGDRDGAASRRGAELAIDSDRLRLDGVSGDVQAVGDLGAEGVWGEAATRGARPWSTTTGPSRGMQRGEGPADGGELVPDAEDGVQTAPSGSPCASHHSLARRWTAAGRSGSRRASSACRNSDMRWWNRYHSRRSSSGMTSRLRAAGLRAARPNRCAGARRRRGGRRSDRGTTHPSGRPRVSASSPASSSSPR